MRSMAKPMTKYLPQAFALSWMRTEEKRFWPSSTPGPGRISCR